MPEVSPLSPQEREAGRRLAEENEGIASLVGDRGRTVLVQATSASRDAPADARHAEVAIHDHGRGGSVVAVVDLKTGEVLSALETPVQFQLSADERREAEDLAESDERITHFLRGREMRPLTRLYFPPESRGGDRSHRYAIVFLRPSRGERKYAIVDLTANTVVDFLDLEDLVRKG